MRWDLSAETELAYNADVGVVSSGGDSSNARKLSAFLWTTALFRSVRLIVNTNMISITKPLLREAQETSAQCRVQNTDLCQTWVQIMPPTMWDKEHWAPVWVSVSAYEVRPMMPSAWDCGKAVSMKDIWHAPTTRCGIHYIMNLLYQPQYHAMRVTEWWVQSLWIQV